MGNQRSQQVNTYEWSKKEKIGIGNLCEVYKCLQKKSKTTPEKMVAIKVFKKPSMSQEETNLISHAFSMAIGWSHPNINAVHCIAIIDGFQSLVMEYADLGNLHDYKFKDEGQKIQSALAIVQGLKFLHLEQNGVIHRNLKPTNILFKTGPNGQVVTQLGDAGFGKVLISNAGNTQFEDSPAYRALEILEGSEYDLSADIYSLSTILYEILMGQDYPMPKHKGSLSSVLKAMREHERPSMVELGDKYQPLAALIRKGWSPEPKDRPLLEEFERELMKL